MSAKVIKALEPAVFVPFPIPSLNGDGDAWHGSHPFEVPQIGIDTIQPAAPPVPFSAAPEDILANARAEAARIIAEAEENRSLVEQAAIEKAEMQIAARIEAEVSARVAGLRTELAETIAKVSAVTSDLVSHVEADLVDLSLQIAKKIVRREVTIDREIALTLVRVSLGKLNQRSSVEVHLNPGDLAFVRNNVESLDFRGALELIEDPSVTPGGCLIHTEAGDIDARIESQFDEIAYGLLN